MKHKIVRKEVLSAENYLIEVEAPLVSSKYKSGQFVILRIHEKGERIPLTVADIKPEEGAIVLVFQVVGKTTKELAELNEGDTILDCVGPLGNPSEIEKFGRVVCIGGGTGIACIYPVARALAQADNEVISIIGARTESLLFLEDEMAEFSSEIIVTTDDGTKGHKGFVTDVLKKLMKKYKNDGGIDRVFTIGPPVMMKAVAELTRPHGITTIASLNTIIIDGSGMCGSCRVFVDGKMKLCCVSGPEFDAHSVNFEDVISRLTMFKKKEAQSLEYYEGRSSK
jgi:ferredoxin--NADP+ reductase